MKMTMGRATPLAALLCCLSLDGLKQHFFCAFVVMVKSRLK